MDADSYGEGLASHTFPKSCVVGREAVGEALGADVVLTGVALRSTRGRSRGHRRLCR
jgi:hypothetical protein